MRRAATTTTINLRPPGRVGILARAPESQVSWNCACRSHHVADEFALGFCDEKEFRLDSELVPDHQLRLVSGRIVRKDAGPKQDERLLICGLIGSN